MKDCKKHVGKNIRTARKNMGLTIEMLAELAGISESFLGMVERGESSISLETLIKLCEALGASADSIVMDGKSMIASSSDKRDILFALLKNASDGELDFFIDYVKLYRGRIMF